MTLWILVLSLLPAFSVTLFGPFTVIGQLGSSVAITCHYRVTSVNVHGRKFWCKMSQTCSGCDTIASTTPFIAPNYLNRTSVSDFPTNGTFMLKIEHLEREDAGRYRCGIGRNNNGFFFPVNLSISEDPSEAGQPELISSELRGSVTIRCELQKNVTSINKFWCRMVNADCYTVADSNGYVDAYYEGRIVIAEDRDPGIFKVLINYLKKEDTGWYRCGMETSGNKIILKDVNLHVSEDIALPKRPIFLQAFLGGSVSANCYQELRGTFNLTYWCKWKHGGCTLLIDSSGYVNSTFAERISMTRHSQDIGAYTVSMKRLRETDAGWFWCGITDGIQEHTFSMNLHILKGSTLPTSPTQTTSRSRHLSTSGDSFNQTNSLSHRPSPGSTTHEKSQSATPSTLGMTTPFSNVIQRAGDFPVPNVGSTRAPSRQYDRSTGMGLSLSVAENQTEPRYTVPGPSDYRKTTKGSPSETIRAGSTLPTSPTQTTSRSKHLSTSGDSFNQTNSLSHRPSLGSTTHEKSQSARLSTLGLIPPPSSMSQREGGSSVPHVGSTGLTEAPSWQYGRSSGTVGPASHAASPHANTRGRTQSPTFFESNDFVTDRREREGARHDGRSLRSGPDLLSILVPVLVLTLLLAAGLVLLAKLQLWKQRERPAESTGTKMAMDEVQSLREGNREEGADCREEQETDVAHEMRQLKDPEESDCP
uniref:polymeric immunoglobulin receptor-like isoform X2 n=1 Tax=Geotrypetes seraphini TaxID=260995 RepID=UPI0014588374|nr:polymeric immunoglobulin receptor-like isoform X2 [Geotrypetes seraphini]